MKARNWVLVMAIAAVFVIAATACGGAAPAAPTQAPAAAAPTQAPAAAQPTQAPAAGAKADLSMWYFNWPPGYQFQETRVQSFMKEHPDITVKFDHSIPPTGEGGFEDKVTASLATGTAPDIFAVINPQAIKVIDKGQVAPIDADAAKALGFDSVDALKASRFPNAFDSWSDSKGVPYGYHWELSWLLLYCNEDQLKAGGVDPATMQVNTWDDLVNIGQKVIAANPSFYKDSSGKFVKNFLKLPMYYDDTWSMQVLTAFLAQSKASVLNSDKTAAAINSPEGVKALQTMVNLSTKLGDPNVGPTEPGAIHSAYAAGEMTCDLGGPWLYDAFVKVADKPIKSHAYGMPTIDGTPGNVFWGWAWMVNAQSKHKAEAWQVIKYIEDDPRGQAVASGIWQPLPGIDKLLAKDVPFADSIAGATKGAQAIFVTEQYAAIARILRGKIESMAFSGADIKSSLDAAANEINAALKQ